MGLVLAVSPKQINDCRSVVAGVVLEEIKSAVDDEFARLAKLSGRCKWGLVTRGRGGVPFLCVDGFTTLPFIMDLLSYQFIIYMILIRFN